MKQISREDAVQAVKLANTMSMAQIRELQRERLKDLVAHARKNSALYREKIRPFAGRTRCWRTCPRSPSER